jgi:hypothetical protein
MIRLLELLVAGALAVFTSSVSATLVTGTLSADNWFGLYYGSADASSLTLVAEDDDGWYLAERSTFHASPDDYIFVVAYDYDSLRMWIGDFRDESGRLLWLTNRDDWVYVIGGPSTVQLGWLPTDQEIQAVAANAIWRHPEVSAPNLPDPWARIRGGPFQEISPDASIIWADSFEGVGNASYGKWVLFRTSVPVGAVTIPEPATLALVVLGFAGLASIRRTRLATRCTGASTDK